MTDTRPVTRLYGIPGAEHLYDCWAACWEAQIAGDPDVTHEIWEWTAVPASRHLPTADALIEWVCDNAYLDITEDAVADMQRAGEKPAVVAAFDAALKAWGDAMTWHTADKHVATHTVTYDEDGEPMLNGQPMYRPAKEATG